MHGLLYSSLLKLRSRQGRQVCPRVDDEGGVLRGGGALQGRVSRCRHQQGVVTGDEECPGQGLRTVVRQGLSGVQRVNDGA
eukprot:522430-Heterocapsa_arctica.AAC.1